MAPSVVEFPKSPKCCTVCGIPKASSHFGTIACMACASFFRRTVSFNIRFLCRYSNECQISQDLRFICRSCRFDKCEAVGMKRHLVQPKRNDHKMPKYVQESRKDGIREVVRGYITSAYAVKEKEQQEVAPSEATALQNPESGFSTILNMNHSNLLIWYVEEVQNAMESRQDAQADISQSSYQQFLTTKRRTDSLATDICTLCPGTDLLETNDIEILFRYCSFASLWMDSAWINSSQCHVAPQDSSDPLTTFISHFQSTITFQLARLKLDIYEYAALKAFCIWKLGILDSTITLKIVAGEQYLGITNALSNYYQNVKNLEPFAMATRMADITLLIAPIFNVYQDMLKLYHTLQIEDRFKEE
ncbi:Protein CBR-NHR-234 [Caenorhabditis briggsae]|uniref:Uncharacterized protein n=2 Tax=Caenorhabditis briggsae TaxID=6238 RepID=A0AAE9EC50_CAEBR|nr:Protein CBR-NHR-234 [Caenorhabditis briggsae]ULU08334.1 hypothetical protein L3Y34_019474 [Caenorhabditis briggsae]UMM20267.1 hypothetical protein L5515_015591 [Caenorhabditis briggsae]CAP29673.2 Protein CBR-NHR-234 [Caenorhabditis briggsae]